MVARFSIAAWVALAVLGQVVQADPMDPIFVKWSQLPDTSVNGYDFSSETLVPSVTADDFQCNDPRPITYVHWWGSYYDGRPGGLAHHSDHLLDPSFPGPVMPATVTGFNITFYSDIPAGSSPTMPWSHPGNVLASSYVSMTAVQSSLHTIIDRNGDMILGNDGDEAVWQYTVKLPTAFAQTPGTIYWISIQAVNDAAGTVQWGWHESYEHWNDAAVQNGPQALWGNSYSVQWASLLVKDMAFELSVYEIPEPATMTLLGSGLGILVVASRRKRQP